MKVLLYFEGEKLLAKSGIGRALEHQKRALTDVGIDYTTDPSCTDYDVIHLNTYGLKSRWMANRAKKAGKKIVYHAHSTEEDFRNSFIGSNQLAPLVKKNLVSLYGKADYLITPTEYSKNLLESYGLKGPIKAISNGVDLEKYQPSEEKEAQFKEYFKIQPTEKIIICVGLFFERKGLKDFVALAEACPDYRFIWFGHTPLASIPRDIRQIVTGAHPSNCEFPGYIKGDIIEGAFSGADLFFFPSYEETEGIVVLEALASHQNVLVRDIPVYDGWLQDKVNCYKGTSNQEFEACIKGILEGTLPELKENGFQVAENKSIKTIGEELQAVYETVLN
ncbi:glycosyltransferase family 4 protein [Vagococcus coleopterorum]|uniref:Glycosyltransferase family 4 protein n=1 Tax=Vagococcus coleopterorum TaxID=2714946 RepID=A0A6G8AKP3_9ENTE|nr:glycosyltransferase family 4 protein [Vagococcus coleopterorum]QIL45628.1 glycosyltransferase family 4 protein [Vagococcus coleopterorum]